MRRPKRKGWRTRQQIDLVQHDELQSLVKSCPVRGSSRSTVKPLFQVAFGGVEHMDEQPGALEMGEKLVSEAGSRPKRLRSGGNVRDRQLSLGTVDDAQDRLEGGNG